VDTRENPTARQAVGMDNTPCRLTEPLTVIWRDEEVLQLGLDSRHALVLRGAPPHADIALRALRSWRTPAEVSDLTGVDRVWLDALLSDLHERGLVAHTRDDTPEVPVVGTGRVAGAIARLLTRDGSVRAVVRPVVSDAFLEPSTSPVVVCPATIEPDRVLTRALVAAGRPHLIVRAEPERAVGGPFVVPGHFACARCVDLVRRAHDDRWPHLLAQLCRMECTPTPALSAWASATATAQILGWTAGGAPETLGAPLELDAVSHELTARRWPTHRDCGCTLVAA